MSRLQLRRLLEKDLGGDGEKLAGISRAVLVEQGLFAFFGVGAQALVLLGHDIDPGAKLLPIGKLWRAVDKAVEHVELVRKLVIDDVASVARVASADARAVPRQH